MGSSSIANLNSDPELSLQKLGNRLIGFWGI